MARLPQPGKDIDQWGEILNEYLRVSHNEDGTFRDNTVGTATILNQSVTTDKIADGAITSSKLAPGVIGTSTTPSVTTRIAAHQFDHTGNLVSWPFQLTLTLRQPFMLPVHARRFRIHTRNRNFLTDEDAKASLTGYSIYVGEHNISGAKGLTSAFKAAPYKVSSGVTLTNGTEHISPWIDTTKLKINAYKPMLLSRGVTIPAGAQVSTGGGAQFLAFQDIASQTAAIAADITPNQNFLDTWIEYEYEDKGQPVLMVVSNSLSGPGNVVNAYQRGEISTWHQQWALANGGVVASLAVAGSWAAHYPASSPKWTYYNTASSSITPDIVLFMGLASSDIDGADGSASAIETAKNNLGVAIEKARSLWPAARLIVTTNPPRNRTGALEAARTTFNTWVSNSPFGVEQCIDIDRVLRNPTSPNLIHTELDSGDNTHWSERGHAVVSQLVPAHSRR